MNKSKQVAVVTVTIVIAFVVIFDLVNRTNERTKVVLGSNDIGRRQLRSDPKSIQVKVDTCSDLSTLHLKQTKENEHLFQEYEYLYQFKDETMALPLPPLRTIKNNPYYAAWSDDPNQPPTHGRYDVSVWNDNGFILEDVLRPAQAHWVPPRQYKNSQVVNLVGDYVAFVSIFPGNYGHFLHDHLPELAYIKTKVPDKTKFLLIHNEKDHERLSFIDPIFEKRVMWIKPNQVFRISGQLTIDDMYPPPCRLPQMTPWLRNWMYQTEKNRPQTNQNKPVVVFYSRAGDDNVFHGRVVEPNHEKAILQLIQDNLKKYNRPEEIVYYNGQENGKQMSLENQYKLFNRATTVIGPHGSGLANIIWTNPYPTRPNCHERVKVLEFLVNDALVDVQDGGVGRTYYKLFAFPAWIEYHHIFYAPQSTYEKTYVDLEDMQAALDSMWGEAVPQQQGQNAEDGGELAVQV